ncbi:tRNA dimethylallyltransferase [Pseudosulfitobacter pseudonitzschiae]|uniref:tRNA dimethylallyltransferase n=1 Tax=Pseudosulfitobacter pseudonitzschiae TaxID=1402135 RepID=A0A073IZC5_9RHOB|nr:tRNA (adenosine(37)-N6)-dimethylallyltransferase MiaA [Pseudosulfitobacter pseudonitzschiae]KEJ94811.1 tRNA delta(2)-isopentenylpyrophosphate transferase [Pseudosulfitobacter pseudonitzschiae]QKS08592.1 tRNA (adenosine(37)-N6)-dimethylallyltransferase MiaA [Pseudosulfitobacter pseudonitzschiae]SHF79517.1 tRNA dimethylallyltransferase [Pseudosulfitobacter pseudonitzschiae]
MGALGSFDLSLVDPRRPVLIAGPTASGKSGLALAIAEAQGGVIVNADASQVYDCWQVVTARPDAADLARAPHLLYGHVAYDAPYSAGHWLREVAPLLSDGARPIIVGGTGLYFTALTKGLAEIPATPDHVRKRGDAIPLADLLAALDAETVARIDTNNRARVQRAWEVLQATGRGLAAWHDDTPPPLLSEGAATCIALSSPPDWLNARIAQRFDMMLAGGALDEVAAMRDRYDPALPSCRAIGVPELMAYAQGDATLDEAREAAVIATRQYAKRQRTWQRSKMAHWQWVDPSAG